MTDTHTTSETRQHAHSTHLSQVDIVARNSSLSKRPTPPGVHTPKGDLRAPTDANLGEIGQGNQKEGGDPEKEKTLIATQNNWEATTIKTSGGTRFSGDRQHKTQSATDMDWKRNTPVWERLKATKLKRRRRSRRKYPKVQRVASTLVGRLWWLVSMRLTQSDLPISTPEITILRIFLVLVNCKQLT